MTKQLVKEEIAFNRPKKYRTMKLLGRGACGETIHIHDEDMSVDLVVKKYSPFFPKSDDAKLFSELMHRFRDEARILFQLNHSNIVRVFNYYDYEEHDTAYILMEYVSGEDIVSHLKTNPIGFDHIFEKVVSGFEHLERKGILHRDIRPANILVTDDGEPKIIDFGFGKRVDIDLSGRGKSIDLNWWCEEPPEFADSIYDGGTEVYFVGKLFDHIISEVPIRSSKYLKTIARMSARERTKRFENFRDISNEINEERFDEVQFTDTEKTLYRRFVEQLREAFSQIGPSSVYNKDASQILDNLEDFFKSVMLEEFLPEPVKLCRIFVSGDFRYFRSTEVSVETMNDFIHLLRSLSAEKRDIVIANIFSKLDGVPRPKPNPRRLDTDFDEEIPF